MRGFAIEIDAEGEVSIHNQGSTWLDGDARVGLVWVGPLEQPDAQTWHVIGYLERGCKRPLIVSENGVSGKFPPGRIFIWENHLPPTGQFCVGKKLDMMQAPSGRYRIRATFRPKNRRTKIEVWSEPFERKPREHEPG